MICLKNKYPVIKDIFYSIVILTGYLLMAFILFCLCFIVYCECFSPELQAAPNPNTNSFNFTADDVRETAKLLLDQKKDIIWDRWGSRNTSVILGETPLWQSNDSASEFKKDIIREYVLNNQGQIKKSLFRCTYPIYYELTVNKKLASNMEAWANTFDNS